MKGELVAKIKNRKWIQSTLIIVVAAFINFVQLEYCNQNTLHMPIKYILMNVGILVSVYYVLYAVFRRLHMTLGIVGLMVTVLSIANYYVIQFRGTPLSTKDIDNFATAMSVISGYEFVIDKRPVMSLVAFVLLCVMAVYCKRHAVSEKTDYKTYVKRIFATIGISVLYFYVCFFSSWSLKPKNTFGWSWEMAYHEYGYLAESLEILEASITMVQKPYGYSEEYAAELFATVEVEQVTKTELPNIILILNESWYDLETIVSLDTEAILTPYLNETENAIRGYSMVPMVGTNLSEYELLTGNSLQIMQGITPFNALDMSNQESIVTVLEEHGYHTTAMHPAIATNYSRNIAYEAMGFDEIFFVEDFFDERIYGERPHMTDSCAYETLMDVYENNKADGPQLIYLLTIQNHGGWEVNGEEYDTVKLKNDFGVYRDDAEEYLSCLQLTDSAWKELTDYFSNVEEPTIICMMGDHAPSLAEILAKYWSGMTDDELDILLNSTPYIIWSNYTLEKEDLGDFSINYMAAVLLQMAGIESDPYYNYQNELRTKIPVMSSFNLYITDQNKQHSYGEETEYSSWLQNYFIMEYDRVRR